LEKAIPILNSESGMTVHREIAPVRMMPAPAPPRLRWHLWFDQLVISPEAGDMTDDLSPVLRRIVDIACYAP